MGNLLHLSKVARKQFWARSLEAADGRLSKWKMMKFRQECTLTSQKTVNSIFSAKKIALGYSKKEDVSKARFVKFVWQGVVNHQEHETEKAIINQSAEYRLAPAAQYLSVPIKVWCHWSQRYRQKYVKLIKCFQKQDKDAQNTIDIEDWGHRENKLQQTKESLSIKLSEPLPNLLHAETIKKKALGLLNNSTALVLSPSVIVEKKEKIYLAVGKTHPETYRVTVSATSLVKCSCKGFRYSNLCSHSVAVAEKEDILKIYIVKFKNSRSRASITYPIKADGAGRKGGQKRRERMYPSSTDKSVNQRNDSTPLLKFGTIMSPSW